MSPTPVPGQLSVVDLGDKLAAFSDHWSPKVVGELNGQHVKLAKLLGEFDWHHHEEEDELFLVLRGELVLRIRDAAADGGAGDEVREVRLQEGQFFIMPRGVEHQPVAREECSVLLFEPASTLNTGNVVSERTVAELERL
jgi:mannose-6-phosphate isomerase-like protein (cupin superfamily)